jgi:anti-anti-sigma factor
MRDLLRVDRAQHDGIDVLTLNGELDLASAPVLEKQLRAIDGRDARIVVDLSGCGFIDSTGLTVIVEAASREGHSIALVGPTPQVRRVFEITAVETLVPLFETMAEAEVAFPLPRPGVQSETPNPYQGGEAMFETPETPVTPGEETPEEGGGDVGEEGGGDAPSEGAEIPQQ